MGSRLVFNCDVCGTERRDANHWFEFYDNGEGAIGIRKFGEGNPLLKQVCGQGCAHTLLDRWLSTGSMDAAEVVQNLDPVNPAVPNTTQLYESGVTTVTTPALDDEEIPW